MKKFAITFLLVMTLAGVGYASTGTVTQSKVVDTTVTTADEALALLKAGNKRFYQDQSQQININTERRKALAKGQDPYAVVVG